MGYVSFDSLFPSPSHNYVIKSPNPRILWCGPAMMMPPQQLTSSCPWCPFFSFMIHTRSLTTRVNNTNPTILAAPEAIVANVPNADCSFSITVQQAVLTPSTGYTLIFADPTNVAKVRRHLFFSRSIPPTDSLLHRFTLRHNPSR